jgi:hypothetical protein
MRQSRPFLPKSYSTDDLEAELDIHSTPNDRAIHTLFAILINDIDRRSNMSQSLKDEVLTGLGEAWLYTLEQQSGEKTIDVESTQHGISTDLTTHDTTRRSPTSQARADD